MESGGSNIRTNSNESPFALVPNRLRVVLEEFPHLNVPPGYQPIQNLTGSSSSSTISSLPISNLDEPICNKIKMKRDNQQIDELYASDISLYLRMMEIEEKRKPAIDYIEKVQRYITTDMRGILVNWLFEVADEYKLLSETLHLAVSYVDRFLSIHSVIRSELMLLGVSALLIASKYEETNPPNAVDFCQITNHTYALHEVLEMEAKILKSLNYEMGNPNVITFLRRFVVIASDTRKTSNLQFKYLCNYLADLSLLDYECLQFKPSTVAAAVIFLAKFIVRPRVNPWFKCVANLPSRPELPECYSDHLFFICPKAVLIWNQICSWVGIDSFTEFDCLNHVKEWISSLRGRGALKNILAIWLITCWNIWKARNCILFRDAVCDIVEIVNNIKISSWNWLILGLKSRKNCRLYEWFKFPFNFM